ncbi:MAG: transcription termination/antitermination protein NusG [bacterium]|nr:transcription termination/antitermination protein NusG [bacterium]
MEKKWYVIHTYSGYENKVKANLERRIKTMGLGSKIRKVVIPTETVTEIRGGKRKISSRRTLPGYVLVEMEMVDETWYAVRNTPGVFGFVGDKDKPIPLSEKDIENIFNQMKLGERARPKESFVTGESVRVIDGPFTNFIGAVDEINEKKGKLRVLVTILGRATPVELDFLQVEKL